MQLGKYSGFKRVWSALLYERDDSGVTLSLHTVPNNGNAWVIHHLLRRIVVVGIRVVFIEVADGFVVSYPETRSLRRH